MKKILLVFLTSAVSFAFGQDLLNMLDSLQPVASNKVFATFKTTKIINAQTIETVKKKCLDFHIYHRFGNMGQESGGGVHTLSGWDNIADVRLAFDYGLTDNITIGFARSKINELLDFTFKWRFLEQTVDNKVPLTICLYENAAITPMTYASLYAGTTITSNDFNDRFSYVHQLIFARKFSSHFSLELLPTYYHRNFVKGFVNTDNNATQENDIVAIGVAARYKVTKRSSIVFDYFHEISNYQTNNPSTPFYDPIAIGYEIETGGHVFHLDLTNAAGLNENNFLAGTNDTWSKGGFKLGFSISRLFIF